jgi:tetratricopeptide (TPR) repeat protein
MHRTTFPRQVAIALALTIVPGAILNRPLQAQDGSGERFSILVPAFANKSGAKNSFGEKVADEVNKRLQNMPTHRPVEMRSLRADFKRLGIKEEDLSSPTDGCIKLRQFAGLVGITNIMCGEYEPAGTGGNITARIINPTTQDVFEIEAFTAADPKQAAEQIVTKFQAYVDQIQLLVFCTSYLESQQFSNALDNCDKALAINSKSKVALYAKAQALEKLDRKEEAFKHLQQLIELDPLHQEAIYRAAVLGAELQKTEESAKYFREYLELNPASVPVRLKIAGDAVKAGNPEAALSIVEDGIKRDSTGDVQLKLFAGHFAMSAATKKSQPGSENETEAKQFMEKAVGYYEEVVTKMGAEVEASVLSNTLQAYRRLDQNDKAMEFGMRAIAIQGNNAELLSAYADALNDGGRQQEAITMLERAAQADPNIKVNTRKGLWLLQSGDLEGAKAALHAAREKGNLEGELQDQLAATIAGMGQKKGAEGQYQAASTYYEVAREFATSAETRGMIAFFEGYDVYRAAEPEAKKQTVASARATLPRFQRVVELMNQSAAWPDGGQGRAQILNAARQYIDMNRQIIARGR